MKRTGEIVLSVLGMFFYVLLGGIGTLFFFLKGNNEFMNEMMMDTPEFTAEDVNFISDALAVGGWIIIFLAVIGIAAGIISLFLLKGNKHPKSAGWTLIAAAVIISFFSGGLGIIAGLFYLIAGIMALVRRPAEPVTM